MDLHEVFKKAVRKYYEDYGYDATTKVGGKDFQYTYSKLNAMHEDLVPRRKKPTPKIESEGLDDMGDPEEDTLDDVD